MRRLVAITAFVFAACPSAPEPTLDAGLPPPPCIVFPSEIDFGEVETGTFALESRIVRNSSDGFISVRQSSVAEPFSVVLTPPFLASGRSGELAVGFRPLDARVHEAEVTFSQSGCPNAVLALRGAGSGTLSIPQTLILPPVPVSQTARGVLVLTNTRRVAVDVTIQSLERSPLITLPPSVHVEPATVLEIPVEFAPPTIGAFEDRFVFQPSIGPTQPVTIGGQGGVPIAALGRTEIQVPRLPTGGNVRRTLELSNSGDGPLRLLSLTVTPDTGLELSVPAFSGDVTAHETRRFDLFIAPGSSGPRDWRVDLLTNDPVHPTLSVHVFGTAERLPSCGELSFSRSTVVATGTSLPSPAQLRITAVDMDCVLDDLRVVPEGSGNRLAVGSLEQVSLDAGQSVLVDFELTSVEPSGFLVTPIGLPTLSFPVVTP